jgi:hypothetical protein
MDPSNHRIGLQHWAPQGIAGRYLPISLSILFHSSIPVFPLGRLDF